MADKDFKIKNNLFINSGQIIFEGSSVDESQTTLQVTNPTADRTITLPDATGTIALTSDIPSAYTDEQAQDALGSVVGNGLDYDDNTGAISVDESELKLNLIGIPDGSVSLNSQKITNLATPTSSTDATTKAYVDAVTEGLHIHESVVAATYPYDPSSDSGGNINLATDLENGDVLDGVTLATGNRVLVKNQTTASQNGIYVVQASGSAVRAADFDAPAEVDGGDFVFVTGGTKNDNTGWVQTSVGITTIGTDPIEFTQFSGAGTYLAGNGLALTGSTFEIDTTITVDTSSSQFLSNKTLSGAKYDTLIIDPSATGSIATQSYETILGFDPFVVDPVNYLQIAPSATTAAPSITAAGTDTNISIDLVAKGTGVLKANGVEVATLSGTQTLTNKTITSPTVSGLYLSDSAIVFEGSSNDTHQTTLDVVNPTADRTITLPNVSGTVVTTGDTGSVTSTMIADGTIVNGDINASAAIVDTKLETIATADKVSLSALNIDGGTDIGADLADADLIIVDDGGAGTNRKAAVTRIAPYVFSKISGDITIASNGVASIGANSVALGTDTTGNYIATIAGTSNQVTVTGSGTEDAAVTLSLPQNIDTGSSPTFAGINLGSVTLTDALIGTAVTNLTGTSATVVDSWSATAYNSAKYIVQIKNGTDIQVLEVLVTVDGNNNVYLTEYADVISNASIGTTDADYSSGNVRLLVTASNGTTVKVHKTLIEA